MHLYAPGTITIRRARISDVRTIKSLVDTYAGKVLLAKELVTLYEDVQEFWVAEMSEPEAPSRIVGCGALHVLWEDLAEIRTVAVDPAARGHGVGHGLVSRLTELARELGLARVFVLTFETEFFGKHGFQPINGTPVSAEVYAEMRRSADEGVAEFLDLPYAKPNILGNTRMLLELDD
jgi:amino-acid N-acetyltransferase